MSRFVIGLEEYNTETNEVVKRGYLAGIAPGALPEEAEEGTPAPVSVRGVDSLEDAMLFGLPQEALGFYTMLTNGGEEGHWQCGENTGMRLIGLFAVGVSYENLGPVDASGKLIEMEEAEPEPEALH